MGNKVEKVNKNSIVKRINCFVLIVITIIDAFMVGGYIGDYLNGAIGLLFTVSVITVVVLTMIVSYSVY